SPAAAYAKYGILLFGLLMAVVFGLLILILGYFPVMARNGTLLALFLVSLGISVAFPSLLQIVFGTETNTLDAAGEVTATYDMTVDPAEATAATAQFTGDIQQVPPMVSAVKIDGKRLHELARKGIEVDRPPRPVTVYRYDVEPTDDPLVYRAFVDCSSGTYVRVLAADLGHALGGGAHLRKLRRTSVGAFTLADATSLEDVTVIPMAEAVRGFPIVRVDEATEAAIRVGAVLDSAALGVAGTGPWPILSPTGELLAMYEPFGDGRVKPVVVLVG
ncbi:MAG TPA: hypothetical protein PLS46_14595, partial [Microthrixaceae bacterium]|nr:hypothetical protein [Microthrixaceae bacterium]